LAVATPIWAKAACSWASAACTSRALADQLRRARPQGNSAGTRTGACYLAQVRSREVAAQQGQQMPRLFELLAQGRQLGRGLGPGRLLLRQIEPAGIARGREAAPVRELAIASCKASSSSAICSTSICSWITPRPRCWPG
jgi:hypothetical protein